MDSLITIKTFTLPSEVDVIRARLEAEGITCFVQDELTIQVDPFYSNALGGVKLQVRESDVDKALEILKDGGYISEENNQPARWLQWFNIATAKIPLLSKLRIEARLFIFTAVIVSFIAIVIYLLTRPSAYERLTKTPWCIDKINYNGMVYLPNTLMAIKMVGSGFCEETAVFNTNGMLTLPGINSGGVTGNWKLGKKSLKIQVDTLDYVYNGYYNIDFKDNAMILNSGKTTLFCYPENIQINLPF